MPKAPPTLGVISAQLLLRDLEHDFGERVAHEVRTLRRRCRGSSGRSPRRSRRSALRGSIEFTTTRLLTSSSVVTCAALAKAASVALASPSVVVPVEHEVAGNVIEQLRRTGRERVRGIGDRRQHLVVDLDRLGGVARLRPRSRPRQTRPAGRRGAPCRCASTGRGVSWRGVPSRLTSGTWQGDVAETVGAHVLAGQHQQHAGHAPRRGGVDALDVRVRHRRAQHEGLRHAAAASMSSV